MPETSGTSRLETRLLDHMPIEAVNFFAIFSRFEYALKKANILKTRKTEPYRAEADWRAFAEKLGPGFLEQVRQSEKASTILKTPPKRQMVIGGVVRWENTKAVESVGDLLEAVCHVRNNLFHGGKFHGELLRLT